MPACAKQNSKEAQQANSVCRRQLPQMSVQASWLSETLFVLLRLEDGWAASSPAGL